jgi:hypothetical protein
LREREREREREMERERPASDGVLREWRAGDDRVERLRDLRVFRSLSTRSVEGLEI